jgi:hypothetical protein
MKYFIPFLLYSTGFLVSAGPTNASADDFYLDQSVKKGDVTFYSEWKTNPGSCGFIPNSNQYRVAALSSKYMKLPPGMTNPNNHPICDKRNCILLKGPNGAMVVKVTDTCAGCKDDDVDVADDAYANLANPDAGRVAMQWRFVDCNQYPLGPYKGDTSSLFSAASSVKMQSVKKNTSPLKSIENRNVILPTAGTATKKQVEVPISDEIKKIVAIPEARSLYLGLIQQVNSTLEKIVRVLMKKENVRVVSADETMPSYQGEKPKSTNASRIQPGKKATSTQTEDETTTLTIEEDDEERSPMTISPKPTALKPSSPTITATATPTSEASLKKPKVVKKQEKLQSLDNQTQATATQSSVKTPKVVNAPKKPESKYSSFLKALDIQGDDETVKKFTSFLSSLTQKKEKAGDSTANVVSKTADKFAKAVKNGLKIDSEGQ